MGVEERGQAGTFPSQTVAGRICLLQSAFYESDAYESEAYKLNMFHLFFPLLDISIVIYLRFRKPNSLEK